MDEQKKEPIKKLKLKKTWRTNFTSPTGFSLTEIYCRRCVQYKNPKEFKNSHDLVLDKNGMMSVCRSCCEEIYQDNLRAERDIEKALLKTCRTLNWVFHTPSIEPTIERLKQLREKNPDSPSSFTATYWSIIAGTNNMKHTEIPVLTFSEPVVSDFIPRELMDDEIGDEIMEFWGEGFTPKEYAELQKNFLDFKKDYKVEVKGEVFLVQQICYKIVELDKARKAGSSTDGLLKEIQTMMKNSALTPAMANMANSGKAMDTWGVRIATIQKNEPAEWLEGEEQRKKLKNYYGDLDYFKNFYVRSLKNYILGSKDYISEGMLGNQDEDEDINIDELIIEEDGNAKEEESSTIREE